MFKDGHNLEMRGLCSDDKMQSHQSVSRVTHSTNSFQLSTEDGLVLFVINPWLPNPPSKLISAPTQGIEIQPYPRPSPSQTGQHCPGSLTGVSHWTEQVFLVHTVWPCWQTQLVQRSTSQAPPSATVRFLYTQWEADGGSVCVWGGGVVRGGSWGMGRCGLNGVCRTAYSTLGPCKYIA